MLEGSFGRDNYGELCKLIVKYLGGQVRRSRKNGPPSIGFTMRKPEALHHTRFMAPSINIMKLNRLMDVLPPGMIKSNMRAQLENGTIHCLISYTLLSASALFFYSFAIRYQLGASHV